MKYKIKRTNKFIKQYSKILQQKNFKEDEFITVLQMLSNNILLPPKYKNHLLQPKSTRYMGMPYSAWCFVRVSKEWKRINIIINQYWFAFWFI